MTSSPERIDKYHTDADERGRFPSPGLPEGQLSLMPDILELPTEKTDGKKVTQ